MYQVSLGSQSNEGGSQCTFEIRFKEALGNGFQSFGAGDQEGGYNTI
jgi:hypothetical protein